MGTLGAGGGSGRARRSQQREGGERSGRRAGTFSPTSAPREAAQPPEPRKRQQVVSPSRRAAQRAAETPSGFRGKPRLLGDPSRSTFLPVSLRYPGTRGGSKEGRCRRASPCLAVRMWMRRALGRDWIQPVSQLRDPGGVPPAASPGPHPSSKATPRLSTSRLFVFLGDGGEGEGWDRLLTFCPQRWILVSPVSFPK